MNKRFPVTLRFNSKDVHILKHIVQKEFNHNNLAIGLRTIVLNTAQAYLDELTKQLKEKEQANGSRDTDSNSGEIQGDSEGTDSRVSEDQSQEVDKD